MMTDFAAVEAQARRLIFTYSRAVDRLDRDLLRSIFHGDAHIELGAIYQGGPDGFLDVAMGFMGSMAATRHDVGNVLILSHGPDFATVEAYVQAWHRIDTPEGTRELTVYGRYLSRIEARGGDWRLAVHSEVIDWGRDVASDATWFEGNGEMPKGRRDRGDASYALLG